MIGAGATGGYYGGRLAQAGRDITFLVRENRAAKLRQHGLQIQSPHGNATVEPALITAAELHATTQAFDVIFISTKAYSLAAAMEDFAPAVGPRTWIVPLLNGMRHLDTLSERFGHERVLGGSVRIIADLGPNGEVQQLTPLGELTFGLRTQRLTKQRAEALRVQLTVPGFETIFEDDVIGAMWQKWWLLAALGTVCVLANGSIGQANAVPAGQAFVHAVLDECIAVATANGYPARPALLDEMRGRFSEAGSTLTSSLFRDMSRGLPVEADQILGNLIAHANGVAVPLITAAYVRLKVYEAGLRGGSTRRCARPDIA